MCWIKENITTVSGPVPGALKKMGRGAEQTFSKEDTEMANTHGKGCSTSLAARVIRIKTKRLATTQLSDWLKQTNKKTKPVTIIHAGKNVEKPDHFYITSGNVIC